MHSQIYVRLLKSYEKQLEGLTTIFTLQKKQVYKTFITGPCRKRFMEHKIELRISRRMHAPSQILLDQPMFTCINTCLPYLRFCINTEQITIGNYLQLTIHSLQQ